MKQLSIFIATLVLTCFAFVPAVARADDMDDLDVTMDVFDDITSIDGDIAMMEGPDDDELDDAEDDMDDDSDVDSSDDEDDDDDGCCCWLLPPALVVPVLVRPLPGAPCGY